jgi:hypothetical protein
MKKLIAVLGDRGGTGKTTTAKILWERLRHRPDALAFDLDGTTGAFAQIYAEYDDKGAVVLPQPRSGVTPLLLHAEDREGRDDVLNALINADCDVALVDFPATSLTVLERVQNDWSLFDVLSKAGIEVVTINVVTPFQSSLQNVLRTLNLASHAKPVVVLNEAFGKREMFFLWDLGANGKPSRGKALFESRKGIEIVLPALPMRQAILVDAANSSFEAAVATVGDARDRGYVERWLTAVDAAFKPAGELLGLKEALAA